MIFCFPNFSHMTFTHRAEAVMAGVTHWKRFMGDRQDSRVGVRPVTDVIIKFRPLPIAGELAQRQTDICPTLTLGEFCSSSCVNPKSSRQGALCYAIALRSGDAPLTNRHCFPQWHSQTV